MARQASGSWRLALAILSSPVIAILLQQWLKQQNRYR